MNKMTVQDFIQRMQNMLRLKDSSVIVDWLEFTGEISRNCKTNLENDLDEILRALFFVKNNFNWKVFQQSLRYPTISNEIINAAFCFCQGYSTDEVKKFAEDGKLEGYIPQEKSELESFTLIRNADSKKDFYYAIKEPESAIKKHLRRLSIISEDENISIEQLLRDKTINNMQIEVVGSKIMADAMCYAYTHSMAFRNFYDFSPTKHQMTKISPSELDHTTEAEDIEPQTNDNMQEKLRLKIEHNLADYETEWLSLSQQELLDRAERISAIRMLAREIPQKVTSEQAELLLQFKNPLDALSDSWMNKNSFETDDDFYENLMDTLRRDTNEEDAELFYDMEPSADDESAGFFMSI